MNATNEAKKYDVYIKDSQGIVVGDNNTVTIILADGTRLTVPFLAPPPPPYELVGRDEMLVELKGRLFAGGSLALSALNGLPGVGKTALAVALAHDREVLAHFRDGVLWAGLGREGDAFALLGSWAATLGMSSDEIAKLTTIPDRAKAIRQQIGTRQLLLVVDDAWQSEAALAFKVGGPNCAHVVTTRLPEVAIYFAGEGVAVVHELNEEDSLALLARIAPQVVKAEAEAARELVQAVGGLPLGLILMGNYLRVQAFRGQPRRIKAALKRLRQAEQRLEVPQPQSPLESHPSLPPGASISLQAIIAISDEALDEASRRTLQAFSVFPPKPNTFSEEAALAVAADPIETVDTLSDYGLLEGGGAGRYTLHQTIADYAEVHRSDEATFERMVTYFVDYVEAHEREYDVLETERGNVIAALNAAAARDIQNALVQGTNALYHFLEVRGLYDQAETHLNRAEQAARAVDDATALVTTLLNLGKIAEKRGNYTQAEAYLQEGLTLARKLGHRERLCALLQVLGGVVINQGRYEEGEAYLQEGLELARALKHRERISDLLQIVGGLAFNRGMYDQAEAHFQEGLALAQALKHRRRISTLLLNLGVLAFNRGVYDQAEAYYQEGLELARKLGQRGLISLLLVNLGVMAFNRGTYNQAEAYYQEGLVFARELGHPGLISAQLLNLGEVAAKRGAYDQAEVYYQEGLAQARALGHRERISALLLNLGKLAANRGAYDQTEAYLQEGLTLARQVGHSWLTSGTLVAWGQLYLKRQSWDLAVTAFCEALEIAQKVGIEEFVAQALYGLAQVAFAQDNIAEARRQGQESLAIFEKIGHADAGIVAEWLAKLNDKSEE